jgi:hypothetical protein
VQVEAADASADAEDEAEGGNDGMMEYRHGPHSLTYNGRTNAPTHRAMWSCDGRPEWAVQAFHFQSKTSCANRSSHT